MPKINWGKDISPEINRAEWLKDFRKLIECRREKGKPTYKQIADAIGCTRQALHLKMENGHFTIEEFSEIVGLLHFTDEEIIKFIKARQCKQKLLEAQKKPKIQTGVYFIANGNGALKVGKTKNLDDRLASLQTSSPYELRVIAFICCGEKALDSTEDYWHSVFSDKFPRLKGEWFETDSNTALITINASLRYWEKQGLEIWREQ